MPISKIVSKTTNCIWGIWEISESKEELLGMLVLTEHDQERLDIMKVESTQKEYLASRILALHLLKEINEDYYGIKRDENKKPYLVNSSIKISISHSKKIAAVILERKREVGIDIQFCYDKITTIAPRVLTPEELTDGESSVEKLITYWGMKEVLYKIQGRKGIDFKKQLHVSPFKYLPQGISQGKIIKDNDELLCDLYYEKYKDFIVCYSC